MLAVLVLVAGVMGACGNDAERGGGGPLIVVTTSVLGDVVSTLAGDEVTVEVLMPPGTDPHDYEPSARTAARLRHAELVVSNGLGLEVGLASTLEAARGDGVVILEVGELVNALPFAASEPADPSAEDHDEDHGHEEDEGHDHDHGAFDPHFWHDPHRMIDALPGLVAAMSDAIPDLDSEQLEQRADAFEAELLEVDAEMESILAVVPAERRLLLTNHHNLGYFADRFGFEIVGNVIPGGDTMASPSAAELAALVGIVETHQLPAIFAETVTATAIAETLAAEVGFGVEVVELYTDSLGEPDSAASTYLDMLRTNAQRVAGALR